MIVHFPIALFIMALGFEMVGVVFKYEDLHKAAVCMLVSAALMAPIVVRTGLWEAAKIGLGHSLLDQHRQFTTWLMWFSLMSLPLLWFVKKEFNKYFRLIFIVFLIGSAVLVSVAADKGGRMVFRYGVGVE